MKLNFNVDLNVFTNFDLVINISAHDNSNFKPIIIQIF